jgi:DNA invertase Pin-like site-specific DNA recombinase
MIDTRNARLVGYARVSTSEQELALQIDALSAHGVSKDNLFCDKLSGAREDRSGLVACLASLEHGDTLVVWLRPGHAVAEAAGRACIETTPR